MWLLAAQSPADHVLPHRFFQLLPFNFNFGVERIPVLGFDFGADSLYFTNQLLMTLVAGGLCWLIFPRVARAYAAAGSEPRAPRGMANLFEALLQFIREEVARPALRHRTDQFVPFLWTLFFFILFCNLLGMVPLAELVYLITGRTLQHVGGTATGNLAVTGGLALCSLFMIHVSGVREAYRGLVAGSYGRQGERENGRERVAPHQAARLAVPMYIWNFAPHVFAPHGPRPKPSTALRIVMVVIYGALLALEVRNMLGVLFGAGGAIVGQWLGLALGIAAGICAGGLRLMDLLDAAMWAFLFLLELIGAIIKPFALMIRLFANMIAGHIVLASILLLIPASASYFVGVTGALGCVAISGLELFVAFLQAYIFVFLTTLFISMSVEPEH